ncbi:MAG: TonB-dependent receptor [Saprospiraceae bacterium]|nr:TonB-dependent receptor [Lewinella sp.]
MFDIRKTAGLFVLLGLHFTAFAQSDTLIELPEVQIAASTLRSQTTGGHSRQWNTDELQETTPTNLGDWLSREGGLFLKSYGNGSIATTSIRGGSAGHTSVLWNGLPIQSPMLGQLDFSLFPVGFIDRARLVYGGNSAAWGSGAIGGVIELDNRMPADSTFALSGRTTLGSFGLFDQQLSSQFSNGKWSADTRLFYRRARNDFPYRLRPDLPEKRQTNAALQQEGILQNLYWKPRSNQELGLHLWVQQSEREIPPTTVQNQSQARQEDRFFRFALSWKNVTRQGVWQARLGIFRELIDFQDEQILLQSLTGFWTVQGEMSRQWVWSDHHHIQLGVQQSWLTAQAEAYTAPPEQWRSAPFLRYRYQREPWQLQFNLRQELVDGQFLPLIPGLGADFSVNGWLTLQAKVSRNYRLPTFNDLYWQPGGNPDLLPESGWSQEGGFQLHFNRNRQHFSYRLTAFNRQIENWILWSRPADQAFWSSNNIAKVWSRGLEQRLNWQQSIAKWKIHLQLGYDLIRSTNEVALENPKIEKGEQLVYVPRHQAFAGLDLRWQQWHWQYRQTYTGSVHTLNTDDLAAYHLGFTSLSYRLSVKNWTTQLFFNIDNLWNTDYRVIERRVMPGRNVQLGLLLQIQKKHSTL